MPAHLTPSLLAGLAAAALFLLALLSGLGFFFLFLPCLPLLYAGLTHHSSAALGGAFAAMLLVALLAGPATALLFAIGIGLPGWYITRFALRSQESTLTLPGGKPLRVVAWYPMGLIFTRLCLYGCALIVAMAIAYAGEPGGLEGMVRNQIEEHFTSEEPQMQQAVELLAGPWSFLVFSSTLWLWCLSLYAHLWVMMRFLRAKERVKRPDIMFLPFPMPGWMLQLAAIAALASLIGSAPMAFVGKTLFISLLFPYFLQGMGLLHISSIGWPNRRILLFIAYFLILSQLWPALALAAAGLLHHIKHLYFRPPSIKS